MPQPRRTDRAAIVSAAIEVLDENGLDGLSLRAIAARLGVQQPALYHHVASKADLLAAVGDEVLDRGTPTASRRTASDGRTSWRGTPGACGGRCCPSGTARD